MIISINVCMYMILVNDLYNIYYIDYEQNVWLFCLWKLYD